MKTLTLLLALLLAPLAAFAQEAAVADGALVDATEISGLRDGQLSPGLRQAITELAGKPLSAERTAELAARIEGERPDVVAAVRTVPRPDNKVLVVFLVARISDSDALQSDINSRYVVESVTLDGTPDTEISQALRDEMQAMVGQPLDAEKAERLRKRIASELTGMDVGRRTSRGSERGKVTIVYELHKRRPPPMIPFAPSRTKIIYHEDLKWSGGFTMAADSRYTRSTFDLVLSDRDSLLEKYSGYLLRIQNRKVGTERLGASLAVSWFKDKWAPETLTALETDASIPEAYRRRRSVEPAVTFAIDRHLRVSGGMTATNLLPLDETHLSQQSNAMFVGVGFDRQWRLDQGISHDVKASFGWQNAATGLGSDFIYQREEGHAAYTFRQGPSTILASASFGRLTGGAAPLFERFALGDSQTLRGWNKFDVSPAGGDRMHYESIEVRYHHLALFLDAGAVWQAGLVRRTRLSTGFGYHKGSYFLTFGFPLNADRAAATFMLGWRP